MGLHPRTRALHASSSAIKGTPNFLVYSAMVSLYIIIVLIFLASVFHCKVQLTANYARKEVQVTQVKVIHSVISVKGK